MGSGSGPVPVTVAVPFVAFVSKLQVNVLSSDVIIVLPGAEGTASEAQLALHYGRPCVAYLDDRSQVPDLPLSVPVESEFERVKQFVFDACRK